MPGLDLLYTIKQLYLFSTLCDYVSINIQISGSHRLETTAHKLACIDDWQNLRFSASATAGENSRERLGHSALCGCRGWGGI